MQAQTSVSGVMPYPHNAPLLTRVLPPHSLLLAHVRHCRLTSGNARRPSDLCWLIQLAWALLEAGEDLVVLEALGSSSSRGSSYTGAAAASMSGLELLRELVCSTASGANCKLVLDSPNAAAAGVNLLQVSWLSMSANLCVGVSLA